MRKLTVLMEKMDGNEDAVFKAIGKENAEELKGLLTALKSGDLGGKIEEARGAVKGKIGEAGDLAKEKIGEVY
jgi:hypothetical protein